MSSVTAVTAEGAFGQIAGLPLHPLVVHAVVVLLPLAALGLVLIVAVPRWRRPLGWVVLAGLVVGTGAALLAKESGEALSESVGLPVEHARWGDVLPWVSLALLLVAAVWFWLDRRAAQASPARTPHRGSQASAATRGPGARSALVTVTGVLAAGLAVATIVLSVVVGHSGAVAVWGGTVPADGSGESGDGAANLVPSPPASSPVTSSAGAGSPTATPTGPASGSASAPGASPSVTAPDAYTLAQVAQHSTATDCWSAVGGSVYDLTDWIPQHPGGPQVIEALCGRDGTAAFNGQHQGQQQPAQALAGFRIGALR